MPPGRPKGVRLDGELLKRRRETLGWTQRHLASAAVLSVRTVQAAELGHPVSLETGLGVCVTLGVPYVEALEREPEEVAQALMLLGYAPLEQPSPFVGREAFAARVAKLFAGPSGRIVLEGPAGIGKSSLARHLCGALADAFPDGIVWIRAKGLSTPTTRERAQRDLAQALGFFDRLPLPELAPRRAFDLAFVTRMWSRRRLLVLDDVVAPEVVDLVQPDRAQGHVLITTRGRSVAEALGGEVIEVPPWSQEQARAFFGLSLGEPRLSSDPGAAHALVRATQGVPAHAAEAVNVLAARPSLEISTYLAEEPSWGRVEGLTAQASPEAAALLLKLGVVHRAPFSLEWACALTGVEPATAAELLAELAERYLVHRSQDWDGEEPSPRYHLDSRVLDLLEGEPGDQRLVDAGVRLAAAFSALHPRLVFGRVERDLPLWVSVADAMCEHVDLPDDFDLDNPHTLPRGQVYPGAEGLPELLWNLRGALRFGATAELSGRLAAAAAVTTDPIQFGRLAGLLSWQLMHVNRRHAAARWASTAAQAFAGAGAPGRAARCAVFANFMERPFVTPSEHLASSRRVEAAHPGDLSALVATAVALLESNPKESLTTFERAHGCIGHLGDHDRQQVEAALQLQMGLARRLMGGEADSAVVRRSVLHLRSASRPEVLTARRYNDLGHLVSGAYAWPPLPSAQVLLTTLPALVRYRLNHLYEIAVALQGGDDGTARFVATPLGRLLPEVIVNLPPFVEGGFLVEIPLPLEPMRSFLSGDGLTHALAFVGASGGPNHPAWRALSALSRDG